MKTPQVAAIPGTTPLGLVQSPIQNFHSCCRAVLQFCPDGYAKAYAKAGLEMTDPEMVRVQILYILNNTGSWRGEVARHTKAGFKQIEKGISKR